MGSETGKKVARGEQDVAGGAGEVGGFAEDRAGDGAVVGVGVGGDVAHRVGDGGGAVEAVVGEEALGAGAAGDRGWRSG